jgi:hypothetical protein
VAATPRATDRAQGIGCCATQSTSAIVVGSWRYCPLLLFCRHYCQRLCIVVLLQGENLHPRAQPYSRHIYVHPAWDPTNEAVWRYFVRSFVCLLVGWLVEFVCTREMNIHLSIRVRFLQWLQISGFVLGLFLFPLLFEHPRCISISGVCCKLYMQFGQYMRFGQAPQRHWSARYTRLDAAACARRAAQHSTACQKLCPRVAARCVMRQCGHLRLLYIGAHASCIWHSHGTK